MLQLMTFYFFESLFWPHFVVEEEFDAKENREESYL